MMTPREVEVMELIGSQVRTGIKPVIVADEQPVKWYRPVIAVLVLVFVVVSVFLNAAQYEVSEDVPGPVWLEGGR